MCDSISYVRLPAVLMTKIMQTEMMLKTCIFVLVLVLGTKAANLDPFSPYDELGTESTNTPENYEGNLQDTMMKNESILPNNTQDELPGKSQNWQANLSLHEVMEYLFEHKVGADVTFKVIDKEGPREGVPLVIQAHKTVLMARSSVMSELLNNYDPGTETKKPAASPKEVTITNADQRAFHEMLRYMYTDKANITPETVTYIAAVAHSYDLMGLQKLCEEFMQEYLSEDTVFDILKHAIHFSYFDLIQKCLDMIAKTGSFFLKSPKFTEITLDVLTHIVDIPKINCFEVQLFKACVRWAEAECQRKNCSTDDKGTY